MIQDEAGNGSAQVRLGKRRGEVGSTGRLDGSGKACAKWATAGALTGHVGEASGSGVAINSEQWRCKGRCRNDGRRD